MFARDPERLKLSKLIESKVRAWMEDGGVLFDDLKLSVQVIIRHVSTSSTAFSTIVIQLH